MAAPSNGPERPAEHREPTPATIRQLYGSAFECGKPGCHRELYEADVDTGKHVLNSRVAHIHARREGGPRWNPHMSESENRDASNLLLLCLLHAWEIDDAPAQYPPSVLRAWKAAQLADYRDARKNWQLSDSDVAEALTRVDIEAALREIADAVPFNPRMRSWAETWKLAVRRGHARRYARLTPLVVTERRESVLAHMASYGDAIVEVLPGQVRVLVARMGAGKSEIALRWWEQGLQEAATNAGTSIPLFFTARQITSTLESLVAAELGRDPDDVCRVVIDDLDSVPRQDALRMLSEARQLVLVWPNVSVLASTRPGIPVPDEETIDVHPWPVDRGAELLRAAFGDMPWNLWTAETRELLTSPLTVLALAARLHAGQDAMVSRQELLSDLATAVMASHDVDVSDDAWHDLVQLAIRILQARETVTAQSFLTWPRVRRLLDTGLVAIDQDALLFALPILEQYFGSQAIVTGAIELSTVAAPTAFPMWRYPLAFTIASASPPDQEDLLTQLSKLNPAAAFWLLDEVADSPTRNASGGASNDAVAEFIRQRDHSGIGRETNLAIRAGAWLREAEKALLDGLGPLAEELATHRDGHLVRWGAWLENGYITIARAFDAVPPPEVVELEVARPKITISGWQSWAQFRFPTNDFGRWLRAQQVLQKRLRKSIQARTLPTPLTSWLARERMYFLAAFVHDFARARHTRPITLPELRPVVSAWMDDVRNSVRATWEARGRRIDSDDVRWLSNQLSTEIDGVLERPWPHGDLSNARRWAWERYSPELTLAMANKIVREALVGYRLLVDHNFSAFGDAMGLYSMFPLRVEGLVGRFPDDEHSHSVSVYAVLQSESDESEFGYPTVNLQLVSSRDDPRLLEFDETFRRGAPTTTFGQSPIQQFSLPLLSVRAATNVAYRWLDHDLRAVGWVDGRAFYFD